MWSGAVNGAWTQARLDDAAIRMGFSTDATPDMGASAVYLEVASARRRDVRECRLTDDEDPRGLRGGGDGVPQSVQLGGPRLSVSTTTTRRWSCRFTYTVGRDARDPVVVGPGDPPEDGHGRRGGVRRLSSRHRRSPGWVGGACGRRSSRPVGTVRQPARSLGAPGCRLGGGRRHSGVGHRVAATSRFRRCRAGPTWVGVAEHRDRCGVDVDGPVADRGRRRRDPDGAGPGDHQVGRIIGFSGLRHRRPVRRDAGVHHRERAPRPRWRSRR